MTPVDAALLIAIRIGFLFASAYLAGRVARARGWPGLPWIVLAVVLGFFLVWLSSMAVALALLLPERQARPKGTRNAAKPRRRPARRAGAKS